MIKLSAHDFLMSKGVLSNKESVNVPTIKKWLEEYEQHITSVLNDDVEIENPDTLRQVVKAQIGAGKIDGKFIPPSAGFYYAFAKGFRANNLNKKMLAALKELYKFFNYLNPDLKTSENIRLWNDTVKPMVEDNIQKGLKIEFEQKTVSLEMLLKLKEISEFIDLSDLSESTNQLIDKAETLI